MIVTCKEFFGNKYFHEAWTYSGIVYMFSTVLGNTLGGGLTRSNLIYLSIKGESRIFSRGGCGFLFWVSGGGCFLPQGFYHLPTQKFPSLYYFEISILVTPPKKARRKKNAIFWSKFSKKCLKTPFLACFFKILPAAQKIWPKLGQNRALGELEKSIWST